MCGGALARNGASARTVWPAAQGLHFCLLFLPSPCVPSHASDADAEQGDAGGLGDSVDIKFYDCVLVEIQVLPVNLNLIAGEADTFRIKAHHVGGWINHHRLELWPQNHVNCNTVVNRGS